MRAERKAERHPAAATLERSDALIRAAEVRDLPELAELRMLCFRHTRHASVAALAEYMRAVFFDNPWMAERIPSLVYEDQSGKVKGFLGVITRPFVYFNERVRSAVLSTFMVHPDQRGRGVGRELMERYFAGPQDFAWSDVANTATRSVWQSAGGHTAWLHNLYWKRALRPIRSASASWIGTTPGFIANLMMRPVAAVLDPVTTRVPGLPHYVLSPRGRAEPLESLTSLADAAELMASYALRPVYTTESAEWLSRYLGEKPLGRLTQLLVRDDGGRIAGWFVYYVNPRGTGEVVQVVGGAAEVGLVLDHLLHHAWRSGVVTLSGRCDALQLPEMSARGFVFSRREPWVLVHSRRPDVLNAVVNGGAFLSRLEGEWWMAA